MSKLENTVMFDSVDEVDGITVRCVVAVRVLSRAVHARFFIIIIKIKTSFSYFTQTGTLTNFMLLSYS